MKFQIWNRRKVMINISVTKVNSHVFFGEFSETQNMCELRVQMIEMFKKKGNLLEKLELNLEILWTAGIHFQSLDFEK